MDHTLKDAVKFFRSKKVYGKLFLAFKQKYQSYGRVGGSVSLAAYSEEELMEIATFLGMRSDKMLKKRRVTLLQFEKQLLQYKFDVDDLKTLLEAYFDEPLISNQERSENEAAKKEAFIEQMIMCHPMLSEWLNYIKAKSQDTYWIHRTMDASRETFKENASILSRSMKALPESPVRLPVFAQKLTGQPHAFDRNTELGRLLVHLLAFKQSLLAKESLQIPSTSEDITELLLTFNILRDDITNYVTMANILANTPNGKEKVWEMACETHTVLNLPIRELLDVTALYPKDRKDHSAKDIWIVENSGIFSSLLDEIPDLPLICTHGQFKLSAWKCFDLLVEEDCLLHYASDLDPEGIGMAYRLLLRYPNSVKLWKMDVTSYDKAVSEDENISERRLNQLKMIEHPFLDGVKTAVMLKKRPAYQEALLDEMISELKQAY
ncbi:TIGR02679 family protein [Alkalibacterium subtropicum]|uniref:TIGR02679 family protein n=1 Tax=Alkalibacterium subtropicum TaxID=753702 RepID=A0A1I1GD82_9LACT|nr:TIGR02679 domain-containing protein [Alkalibacterium subtropicum]SFC09426.1 TIGR02679 family protein [Alkalibacterium subtropicum]